MDKNYTKDFVRKTAKDIVEESVVLLKNDDHVLPFVENQKIAFFGRCQIDTIYSGNGSGAAHGGKGKNILEECEKKGICAEPELKAYYQKCLGEEAKDEKDDFDWSKLGEAVNSGIMYEIFGRYHAPIAEHDISEEHLAQARSFTDTALFIIGRNSGGEECDRHLQEDYYLTDSEKKLVEQVCNNFPKVVLILNINGLIDLSWTENYESIKSILFLGIPGEEGAAALAEILVGTVNPSGKLPVTIARNYEDYPSAKHFSWDKEDEKALLTYESYGLSAKENGSVGFAKKSGYGILGKISMQDTVILTLFGKKPLFPFGYGLSYSEFALETIQVEKDADGIRVDVSVKNTGHVSGKETVQLYLHTGETKMLHADWELKGFEKTRLLALQEEEKVSLFIPFCEFAHYDEGAEAYVMEQGIYELYVGNCSRNTQLAARVIVKEEILTKQCKNGIGILPCNAGKIGFLPRERKVEEHHPCEWEFVLEKRDVDLECPETEINDESENLKIRNQKVTNQKVKSLSVEQLAALCVGYGPGTPFSAFGDGSDPETIFDQNGEPVTTNSHPAGFNGYVSPAILKESIRSVFYKDGPAGIGETAWPAEMLIACAFHKELWYQFGNVVGEECERQQVDVWLAPAVNLHRNPIGGRNFEYFSEDPYLTGICACEVAKGVQENHPVLVCPKHFAVNEQETFRRGNAKKNYDAVDSIVQERAARELYLKPFEMLVKDAKVSCIMTSFNKINGTFAGGKEALCTQILRKEWGYQGVVVTDWGDMDIVVDGADAVAAGNDVVMPGGPPVIKQILAGYQEGRVSREQMEKAVGHLLDMINVVACNLCGE